MKKKIKFMSLNETFRRDIKGNKKRERLYNIERTKLKFLETRQPTHPGEILLEEFLKPKKMTRQSLAKKIGVPIEKINTLIDGKRAMTCETAILLSETFGTTAKFWMNLQTNYDLFKATKKISTSYEEGLRERLKDPLYAAEYLRACFESKEGNAKELFLLVVKDLGDYSPKEWKKIEKLAAEKGKTFSSIKLAKKYLRKL